MLHSSQPWSQSWSQTSQSPSQLSSHEPSQLPPKTEQLESQLPSHPELQLPSQPESHDSSQLPSVVHVPESLRARKATRHKVTCKRESRTRGWRANRPAAGATRSFQLPSARAVDSARDIRFVRREGRDLVLRWRDHPAMDCRERNREVDEHRISWSVHRPDESVVTKMRRRCTNI